MVAAFAGGVRKYNEQNVQHAHSPQTQKMLSKKTHILMPVAFPLSVKQQARRPPGDVIVNNFTPISVDLSQNGTVAGRVAEVKEHLVGLSRSVYAGLALRLSEAAASVLPAAATADTVDQIFRRHCCMFSNVKGYVEGGRQGMWCCGRQFLTCHAHFFNPMPQVGLWLASRRWSLELDLCLCAGTSSAADVVAHWSPAADVVADVAAWSDGSLSERERDQNQ